MVSVFDVVAYILNRKKPITAMKLQKLVYYCQAWSLVWDEKPMFKEKIEAWVNGPVVRELYEKHRGMYEILQFNIGSASRLNKSQKETINTVLNYYGKFNSQQLSDLTHKESPWISARKKAGLSDGERGQAEITHASMEEYYSSI